MNTLSMTVLWDWQTTWEIASKIALSAVLGAAVGAEREWTGKPAGLRTHMLIAVGAAILTDLSVRIGPLFESGQAVWDPGRIAAQIVTGIGFIGAGTIIQARGSIQGLTTAAGLWVATAIGMAVGMTFYVAAVLGTVALLVILAALKPLERLLERSRHRVAVYLGEAATLSTVHEILHQARIRAERVRVRGAGVRRKAELTFHSTERRKRELLEAVANAGLEVDEVEESS